jgi:xanthine phosphoribosyltransferase
MSVNKVDLEFLEIKNRLNSIDLPIVDLIVGIAEGGKVPASLIAWILEIPLLIIKINYRDDNNKPRYEIPMLLKDINIPANVKKILLVDDVGVSGKTLKLAEEHLNNYEVTTMVMKGSGDIVLFPEILTCVNWPWN